MIGSEGGASIQKYLCTPPWCATYAVVPLSIGPVLARASDVSPHKPRPGKYGVDRPEFRLLGVVQLSRPSTRMGATWARYYSHDFVCLAWYFLMEISSRGDLSVGLIVGRKCLTARTTPPAESTWPLRR